jgi:hypothetical protein
MNDISKIGLPVPTQEEKAEKLITEAVLIFYRSLGLKQPSINRIVNQGLRQHRIALKKSIAHVLKSRMGHAELFDIVGPIPDIHQKAEFDAIQSRQQP